MPKDNESLNTVKFILDGKEVEAFEGETIWRAARRLGTDIPHLCYKYAPGYRADGNCRACVVEIEGERVLAPSCMRAPAEGMVVNTKNERARKSQEMVFELLMADQDPELVHGEFKRWAEAMDVKDSRFPGHDHVDTDDSHPAITVNLDACIKCNLCVQACREVQVNDVIGMSRRGAHEKIVFDFDDPMGESTCVACGECVQACPTGALLASSEITDKKIEQAERTVDSVCPFCGVGCQVRFHVKDDRILKVDGIGGPANENRLCVKGRFGMDYTHHPHRLTRPLIRKDGVKKIAGDHVDPEDWSSHFREATWEEALDRATKGLHAIRDEKGGGALAGFGSAKGSNEEAYLFQKLVRVGFGTNNIDHCTRLCHASSVAALMETIGSGAVTAAVHDCLDSDVIMVIGANPANNHPVAATYIKNAVKKGATLIVADPRIQGLSRHADINLQFTPGSDVALLNAILHVIIDEELYDRQYVQAHTEGFEELKKHIKAFSPDKMAPLCGIDAETIKKVARTYARAKSSLVFWGMGVAQHTHGTDNVRCLISMALLTGHIGRPGTGLHPLRGQNNVQGASDSGLIPMVYPNYKSVSDPEVRKYFEDFWGADLDPNEGLTVVEITEAIHAGQINGMYIMGENPAMSDPDSGHVREALAKLDHLVVQDIFLTETASYADVILPASAWTEKTGTVTNTDRRVQIGRPITDPPGEARQDLWIINEMAKGLGLDWHYAHPKEVYAEMYACMPSLKNITWERLEKEGAVTYPCPDPDGPGKTVLFGEGFPTPSTRGKMVPCDVLPADEVPDEQYPMILTTGRLLEHWHTGAMTRRSKTLAAIEPVATAHMHPRDLEKMGLGPGDRVKVSTRRGEIELPAGEYEDVPEGVIFIPFFDHDAAANILTNPALDPYGKIAEVKFCAARVEGV